MCISSILPIITGKLFRVVYDNNKKDILSVLHDQWTDTQWLRDFFKEFQKDLKTIKEPFNVNQAVKLTRNDADKLFEILYNYNGENLSDIFKPLHPRELEVTNNQAQKGRIERPGSWLRIYAVHYDGNYIITGGAIKLTRKMERPHLKQEIRKLKLLTNKLKLDINTDTLGYLDL